MAIPLEQGTDLTGLLQTIVGGQVNNEGGSKQEQTGASTNTQTGSQASTQTTKNSADLSALQSVFAKQSAGVTPEMLQAIFQEGAKATPGLISANANALGARAGANANTPLATVLSSLNADLTNKAAMLSQQMLADSGKTAGQIAELTRTTEQSGTQTSNQSSTQTNNQTTTGKSNSEQTTSPNMGNATKLLAAMFGQSVLGKLVPGGITGLVGGASTGIANLLKQLIPGAGGGAGMGGDISLEGLLSGGGTLGEFGGIEQLLSDPSISAQLGGGLDLTQQAGIDQLLQQLLAPSDAGGTLMGTDQFDFSSILSDPNIGSLLGGDQSFSEPSYTIDDPGFWD